MAVRSAVSWLFTKEGCLLDMKNLMSHNIVQKFKEKSILTDIFTHWEWAKTMSAESFGWLGFRQGVDKVSSVRPDGVTDGIGLGVDRRPLYAA